MASLYGSGCRRKQSASLFKDVDFFLTDRPGHCPGLAPARAVEKQMVNEERTLLVIYPGEAVEQQLLLLREKIFAHAGYASALALPQFIPLCYLPGNLNTNAVREVLAAHRAADPLILSGIMEKEQILYLQAGQEQQTSAHTAGLVEKILAVKRADYKQAAAVSPFFPLTAGFFLAVNENHLNIKEFLPLWNPGKKLYLPVFYVGLLRILVHAPLAVWWQNLEWEIVLSVKNKKKGKSL